MFSAGCGHSRAATVKPPANAAPLAARAAKPEPVKPGTYSEQGVASWYGPGFQGRRASNGEIYNMNAPVAAHRTLPFGSIVRVTNLNNGKTTEVRIIDRGPFVGGRVIDLSLAAARAIDMVGTGIAPVKLELVAATEPLAGEFTVQIGAFKEHDNANRLRAKFAARYPVFEQIYDAPNGRFYRVRVGRAASEQDAQRFAAQLRSEGGYQTFVVRLDDAAPAGR